MPFSITNQDRITQLKQFISQRKPSDTLCILYDDDADGVSAGVIFVDMLQKKGFTNIITYPKAKEQPIFTKEFTEKLIERDTQAVFCIDFEPLSWRFLSSEEYPIPLIIIDHHFNQKYEKALFIHPLNSTDADDSSQYCCAKFVYDICTLITNMDDVEWKVLPGMIGDMNIIGWPLYIKEKAIEFNHPIGESSKDFFTNIFGKVSAIINFASVLSIKDIKGVFKAYSQATKPEDMLVFEEQYKDIEETYYGIIQNWQEHCRVQEDLYIVAIPGKFKLTSAVSSIVSFTEPEKTFFFYQVNDGGVHISLRSQLTEIHLGELVKMVSKEFEKGHGGGHRPAAGAYCLEKDLNDFIQRIIDGIKTFSAS